MNIEQIQDMWELDAEIDDSHLGEASTSIPKLHSKYLKLLIAVKLKLAKNNSDYNTLRQTKFRYYRGELSRDELKEFGWDQWQGVKPLKNEMEEFLHGDTDLNNQKLRIEYLNTMIYLLESIMNSIKNRGWDIKNGIAWKQFLAGN
ncbi:Recombination, repair and ssDNA binding protein UvsY [uncultured Caudovirales phage]|uniref:Recombination, repair and ssDNA binding protein UvsY n=1 Tax=uncultured Caudovirales phage TaxID=2100421 RepID=A0A6J5KWG7_9CAUD|nr:Recombination, repair and ssDNA binding protein UvsY [uncultured Caudovirales phage]